MEVHGESMEVQEEWIVSPLCSDPIFMLMGKSRMGQFP